MASSTFVESAILKVIDQSTAPLTKINAALGRLKKTADGLAKSTAFNPVAGAAAARNLAQMATTSERIGKAFAGVGAASNAVTRAGTQQLRNSMERIERTGRLSAAQIRVAQNAIQREYGETLRRIQEESSAAQRRANETIQTNAREHAESIRRAGRTVQEATEEANRRRVAPPPPGVTGAPTVRRPAPPPPPAPRKPIERGNVRSPAAEEIRRAVAAGATERANGPPVWPTREEEKRKEAPPVVAAGAAGAIVAGAIKRSAAEQFEAGKRNIDRIVNRADDRATKAEERLAKARLDAASAAARVEAQEKVATARRAAANTSERATDIKAAERSERELQRRQAVEARAATAARNAEHAVTSAQTLKEAARDTAMMAGDRIERQRERNQKRDDAEIPPSLWQRTKGTAGRAAGWAGDQLRFAGQGIVQGGVATMLHDGWEGAKSISNTRAGMERLGWNEKQRSLATQTAMQMTRDYGTLSQGEAEKIYREAAALLHHPEDAAKVAPILGKAFQDQIQAGQSVHEAEANTQRLTKAAEMSGYLTNQAGEVTPDRLKMFTDTVARVQAIEGRQLTTRDTQMMVKYLRSASGPLDERGLFTTMLLASEEGGSSAGTMINSMVRGMTGKAYEGARVNMVRSGLASGEIVKGKGGKLRVDNFQVNDEEGLRANWVKWIEDNIIGPNGDIAKTKDPKTGRFLDPTNRNDVAKYVDLKTSSRTAADSLTKGINQAGAFRNKWEEAQHIDISEKQAREASLKDLNVAAAEANSSIVSATQRASEAVAPIVAPTMRAFGKIMSRASEKLDPKNNEGWLPLLQFGSMAAIGGMGKLAYENPATAAQLGAAGALTGAAASLTGAAGALSSSAAANGLGGLVGGGGLKGLLKTGLGVAAGVGIATLIAEVAGEAVREYLDKKGALKDLDKELANPPPGIDPGQQALRRFIGGSVGVDPDKKFAKVRAADDALDELFGVFNDERRARELPSDLNKATTRKPSFWDNFITPAFADDGQGDAMPSNVGGMAGGKGGDGLADMIAQAMTPIGDEMKSAGEYAGASIEAGGQSAAAAMEQAIISGSTEGAAILQAAVANISVNVNADRPNTGSNKGFVR